VISAIEDALRPYGVRITRYPVTPALLLELIERSWTVAFPETEWDTALY